MLNHIFHPPPEMPRGRYLRMTVITVTVLSVGLSVLLTTAVEAFADQPNYSQGLITAFLVPLLVVPPLAYWHHQTLYELESSRRKIRELSRQDPLTGLTNRRYFFELASAQAALAQRHGQPLTLLLLDLDDFKQVNDTCGHQIGDEVLHQTAKVFTQSIRETDILARYGGEEFIILLPQTRTLQACALCRRLQENLALAAFPDLGLPQVTVSIGGACSDRYGWNLHQLLAQADQALYQAKADGRDTFAFSE